MVGNQHIYIRAAHHFSMWFTAFSIAGCCLWIAVLVIGQEGPGIKKCGQRWKPHKQADKYPRTKSEAMPNSWPWHVGVYSASLGPYPYCGGTYIAPHWVLTAAHCIRMALSCKPVPLGYLFNFYDITGYHMAVSVADHDFALRERPAYNVQVKSVIIHPSYLTPGIGFDIALLRLKRDIKRSSRTEFACLPEPGFTPSVGEFCYTAGWGLIPNPPYDPNPAQPNKLMDLRTPIVATTLCKMRHIAMNEMEDVCTDTAYGQACRGDSGGGLYCFNESQSKWFVYGALAFTEPGCRGGFNVFTSTTTKLDWINSVMAMYY